MCMCLYISVYIYALSHVQVCTWTSCGALQHYNLLTALWLGGRWILFVHWYLSGGYIPTDDTTFPPGWTASEPGSTVNCWKMFFRVGWQSQASRLLSFSPSGGGISEEITMHSTGQNIFPLCQNASRAGKLHLGYEKKREITTWGCPQCSKGNKTLQERHPEVCFLHVLNALKHDAFPFKNSEPTGITSPYFFELSNTFQASQDTLLQLRWHSAVVTMTNREELAYGRLGWICNQVLWEKYL